MKARTAAIDWSPMTPDLFASLETERPGTPATEVLAEGAVVLRGFALPAEAALLDGLQRVLTQAPLRHMVTPGGYTMSVAMTSCGALGWVSDRRGCRCGTAMSPSGAGRRACGITA